MAFRRFGGHDHRLNVGSNSFYFNRSTPVMQEFGKESNSSLWYSQTPSNLNSS